MFKTACSMAAMFTYPLVVAARFYDDTIESGLGAFVVLNDEGWLITAAHNLDAAFAFAQHQQEIKEYQEKVDKINSNKQLKSHKKNDLLKRLKYNPKWILNFSIMLSGQPIEILEYFVYGEHDLAFLRVDKKVIAEQKVFPKIIDPSKIAQGTSLCKFGYPFVEVKATFNNSNNAFELPKDLLPVPAFPIEGIYTRNLLIGKTQDQSMDILYLETSSPGLRGQSGGPLCDTNGNIYAIQSKNLTVPLGFKGAIEIGKKMVEENQFINIGIGVHPKTIVGLLNKHNIKFDLVN